MVMRSLEHFMKKKKIQKTNHQEFKIGKVIKKREQVLCQMERSW